MYGRIYGDNIHNMGIDGWTNNKNKKKPFFLSTKKAKKWERDAGHG